MLPKLRWNGKDYGFAAVMTLGMIASGLLVPMIAPRFLELVFWAPAGGIFLIAAAIVGEEFATLVQQPLRFGGLIIAVALTSTVGWWWLGEIILAQLKRWGKWKPEA